MHYLDRIKNLREDHDLSQKDLSKKLHISQRTYSYYETDGRSIPIEVICDLADIYHTTTDYILCKTDKRDKK